MPTVVVGGPVGLKRPPASSLGGVAGCVGWNKRWKVEPWAQWESNQEKSFLWIRPRPYWQGGLSISCLKCPVVFTGRCVTAASLGGLLLRALSPGWVVCFTQKPPEKQHECSKREPELLISRFLPLWLGKLLVALPLCLF